MSDEHPLQGHMDQLAAFLRLAIRDLGGFEPPARTRVLDFGCGSGMLVDSLTRLGYDAQGCDIPYPKPDSPPSPNPRLRQITRHPYRLPYDDDSFDVVVSTSVLEHAQNKEECFREIRRVLKPGGCALHHFPAKWYLPSEPHIYVPLANWFWPRCPEWWLALWARLGTRNEYQENFTWREVVASNQRFCREKMSYWPTSRYRELSLAVYGNCDWPMNYYVDHGPGRLTQLFGRLPLKPLWGLLSREVRMALLMHRKTA